MKSLIYSFFFAPLCMIAQVGMGTTEPTAMLEIRTEPDGIPALGLTPQETPTGMTDGQMAVIEDLLYLYDEVRSTWLSAEETTLEFGRLGSGSDPAEIEFGGGDLQNGPIMPFDGTIVSVSISATKDDNQREIYLFKNGVAVPNNDADPNIDGVFTLNSSTLLFENKNFNYEFSEGDMISLAIDSAVNDISNLIVNLRVKWRKNNP